MRPLPARELVEVLAHFQEELNAAYRTHAKAEPKECHFMNGPRAGAVETFYPLQRIALQVDEARTAWLAAPEVFEDLLPVKQVAVYRRQDDVYSRKRAYYFFEKYL